MTVRELIYGLVSTDPELAAIGISQETTFANGAPDSPPPAPGKMWCVLNWGPENVTLARPSENGRSRRISERDVSLWVYSRDDDFGGINNAIKRWCALMDGLEAKATGSGPYDGWVATTTWQGDSADGWDDVYAANLRSSTYTIIASGD
jgi:hypothetical protein